LFHILFLVLNNAILPSFLVYNINEIIAIINHFFIEINKAFSYNPYIYEKALLIFKKQV